MIEGLIDLLLSLRLGRAARRCATSMKPARSKGSGPIQQLYRSGKDLALRPMALDIPFPETGTERPFSDHPGLMVRYALSTSES
jgi:hypothetical protein